VKAALQINFNNRLRTKMAAKLVLLHKLLALYEIMV